MRVSEGATQGRYADLYNPEMFKENEEVIIFTREEFNRTYTSMQEQIDLINKTILNVKEDYELLGYWPKIMERVHILDLNLDLIYKNKPLQCYLDSHIYDKIHNTEKIPVSKKKSSAQIQLPI